MPKRLDQPKERMIAAAREVLLGEQGYSGLTIREIAARCGTAVGTVYNYFPSKEHLAAHVMLEDWREEMARVREKLSASPRTAEEGICILYSGVLSYSRRYVQVWAQYGGKNQAAAGSGHHQMLVKELAGYVEEILGDTSVSQEPFLPVFLAETILHFASDGETEYAVLSGVIRRLLTDKTA